MVMISYSERMQSKISKEKRCVGWSRGKLPVESPRMRLIPRQVVTAPVRCCQPGKLVRDSGPGFLEGIGQEGTLCLARSQIPEGKQVFSINRIFIPFRNSFSYSYQLMVGTFPKSKFTTASQGPSL